MRKLTVKNFSVIKDAELKFGKITVLIGPQSSGKSLLCKLAYFLGGEIIGIAVESLLNNEPWSDFLQTVVREFETRFSTTGWLTTDFKASFSSQHYSVELRGVGDPQNPKIEFNFIDEFQKLFVMIRNNLENQPSNPGISRNELRQDLWVRLSLMINTKRAQANVYIPSGRALYTGQAISISALQNPDLDQITRRFAGQIAWDTKRWKPGLLTTGRNVIQEIEQDISRISGGGVTVIDGKPQFLSPDGRSLPLSLLSSGTQELIPMFNVLGYLAFHQEHFYAGAGLTKTSPLTDTSDYSPLVYLEEPEAHVFPKTQNELVKLFTLLANDPILAFDWVITTHSPYILTAFNDLIKAGQVAKARPEKTAEIEKIVPRQYWIKEGDFTAYAFDGKDRILHPIMDDETGMINGDILDDISSNIADEFGQLLEIQYGG
jgi:hypothetical protein